MLFASELVSSAGPVVVAGVVGLLAIATYDAVSRRPAATGPDDDEDDDTDEWEEEFDYGSPVGLGSGERLVVDEHGGRWERR